MATGRQRIAVAEGLASYGVSMLKDPRIVPKFPRRTVSESVEMDGSVSSWLKGGWTSTNMSEVLGSCFNGDAFNFIKLHGPETHRGNTVWREFHIIFFVV